MYTLKFKSFTLFYGIIFILNLLFFNVLTEYRVVSKPMIMASLIGFYISHAKKQSNAFLLALIFALLGDIFLMFEGDDFFIIGLGCFLIMQVLYMLTFLKDRTINYYDIIWKAFLVSLLSAYILFKLWESLGNKQMPVTIYTLAISAMVISAFIRKPSTVWFIQVIVGVVLFMISDALIAYTKFGGLVYGSEYIIMSTYMIAQYMIVRGIIEQDFNG